MNYAELDDDALRVEVAKRCGYSVIRKYDDRWTGSHDTEEWGQTRDPIPDYPRDIAAAIALLDSMTYPPDANGRRVSVEYVIIKQTYGYDSNIDPLDTPQFTVTTLASNPVHGHDYEATADTKARAACRAWLMWGDAMKDGDE